MAEAKTVLTRKLRWLGPDQLLPDERSEPGRDLPLLGGECLDCTAVEHLALDGSTLEHATLGRIELIQPRSE